MLSLSQKSFFKSIFDKCSNKEIKLERRGSKQIVTQLLEKEEADKISLSCNSLIKNNTLFKVVESTKSPGQFRVIIGDAQMVFNQIVSYFKQLCNTEYHHQMSDEDVVAYRYNDDWVYDPKNCHLKYDIPKSTNHCESKLTSFINECHSEWIDDEYSEDGGYDYSEYLSEIIWQLEADRKKTSYEFIFEEFQKRLCKLHLQYELKLSPHKVIIPITLDNFLALRAARNKRIQLDIIDSKHNYALFLRGLEERNIGIADAFLFIFPHLMDDPLPEERYFEMHNEVVSVLLSSSSKPSFFANDESASLLEEGALPSLAKDI